MDVRVDKMILRQYRQERGLSQEALAAAAGLHPRTVQRIESSGVASLSSLRLLARALAREPADLELVSGADIEQDASFSARAWLLRGIGAAFLWAALSALVWVVVEAPPAALAGVVSALGFLGFCIGLQLVGEAQRRANLLG